MTQRSAAPAVLACFPRISWFTPWHDSVPTRPRAMPPTYRLATLADVPALEALIPLSARTLQLGYYTAAQIEGALGTVFGVDTQLIRDGTYFVAVDPATAAVVGCGGWS